MKLSDFFSERMIFGVLIITGFIVMLHELIYEQAVLKPEIISIVAGGIGALGASVGIITQAIWKTDRNDKQAAQTMATLATAVAAQSPNPPTEPTP